MFSDPNSVRRKISQRAFIVEIKRVAVGVRVSIGTSVTEYDAGVAITPFKCPIEVLANGFERHLLCECKVQVL
jgi:hypothetical protein